MDGVGARTMLIKKKKNTVSLLDSLSSCQESHSKAPRKQEMKRYSKHKGKGANLKKKKKALTRYSVGSAPLNSVRTSLLKGEHSSNHPPPPRMRIKGHAADLINHTFLLTATKKKKGGNESRHCGSFRSTTFVSRYIHR